MRVNENPAVELEPSIWSCGKLGNVDDRCDCFVKCTVNGPHFFRCYLPPSLSIGDFKRILYGIVKKAMNVRPAIIAGDFNAWAVEWSSAYPNPRGE